MTTLSPHVLGDKYHLGTKVKWWVVNAGNIIGPQFGVKTEYGWRATDPFPDHPSGHAIDFMIPNPQGSAAHKATGDALAAYVIANSNQLGVKYLIWWHRYWSPSTGWEPYTQTTNPHTDHVHVTFTDRPAAWTGGNTSGVVPASTTDTSNTGLITYANDPNAPDTGVGDTCAQHINFGLMDTCLASKKQVRIIAGMWVLGAGALVVTVGLIILVTFTVGRTKVGGLALNAIPGGSAIKSIL